ncbi:unnamed protein product [Soboliphyme baturini]|uniref:Uncharacterized protein n=1 Tax=Soboliphyme baturini TaxID=241478 RepID=A0A183IK68_9BILA|nr:unnamed protein product [Soboliphyme baturini]
MPRSAVPCQRAGFDQRLSIRVEPSHTSHRVSNVADLGSVLSFAGRKPSLVYRPPLLQLFLTVHRVFGRLDEQVEAVAPSLLKHSTDHTACRNRSFYICRSSGCTPRLSCMSNHAETPAPSDSSQMTIQSPVNEM